MQVAAIEFGRNVLGLAGAHSTEFDRTSPHPVIAMITEWQDAARGAQQRSEKSELGGTMRLGAQDVELGEGTLARQLYGADVIRERHRHRYEFNNNYLEQYRKAGLKFSGFSHDGLVEIIELPEHPWFVATQFHPEFTSNPRDGHPLFTGFVKAARAAQRSAAQLPAGAPAHEAGGGRDRQQPAPVPDRRPLRHRKRRRWSRKSPAACRRSAHRLALPLVFKASFDKANRSSAQSFRGPGIEQGLEMLAGVRRKFGVPVLTDVHEDTPVDEVAAVVDVLQTPAFLCRQTDFIQNVARAGKPVNIKKGQFLSPWEMGNVVDKARAAGNPDIMVCERGVSLRLQQPGVRHALAAGAARAPAARWCSTPRIRCSCPARGATPSGGQREFVPVLARAAVAAGVAGIFMETHPDPDKALSDGPNAWPLARMEALLEHAAGDRPNRESQALRGRPAMSRIVDVLGREIIDSRGNPTVEAEVRLDSRRRGPRRRAFGRLHRHARSRGAARRRQAALPGQGRAARPWPT